MTHWTNVIGVDPVVALALLAIIGGAFTAMWRRLHKISKSFEHFSEDWNGVPGRPGVPERPGVMVRLANQDEQLAYIRHELSFNSGMSVKDSVARIERAVAQIQRDGSSKADR